MTPSELSERLLRFAARISVFIGKLPDARLGRHVFGQLVRCGTAGGHRQVKNVTIAISQPSHGTHSAICTFTILPPFNAQAH